jgi:outer membrane receptor protein involved in Fe transport
MLRATKEGLYIALLVGMVLSIPAGAIAQEPGKNVPPAEPPAKETPAEEPPAEEGPPPSAPKEKQDEVITRDVDDQEWITPDVGAQEERDEEDEAGDVDEVIIEYSPSPDMREDTVKDAAGKELEAAPSPVVSKSVEVQDPDELEPGADKQTGVHGQVVSRRPKKVLPDAPVIAKGEDDGKLRSTITDERGRYRLYLPPGKYTLRSYYDLYHGARWDDIAVKRGKFSRVNFILDPISDKDAGVEEQEVVYLADTSSEAAQMNIRKESVSVQDAISSEEIKRSGDSTAQGAVKRVVGVTIDDDGRVIIRGLGGNYNRILLNGIPIPGVDPDVPSVNLDIFPADVVSNLAVVKTPRPDLPGNFAGGLLLIETSSYPRDFMLKAGASFGANTLSTFQQMPTREGGRLDFVGYDDGTRALPPALGSQRLSIDRSGTASGRYQSFDQLAQVGRAFPDAWNPRSAKALPQMNLKVSLGDSGTLKKPDRKGGYLMSFTYQYEDVIRDGYNKKFNFNQQNEATQFREDFDFKSGSQEVLWGGFLSAFVELDPDNFLNLTTLFSRTSEDEALIKFGVEEDNGDPQTRTSYDFIGRTLFFNQLTGDHRNLGHTKSRYRWNVVTALGKRDQPDRRYIQQFVETQRIPEAILFYSDLNQLSFGGTTDVRFPLWSAFESTAYATVGLDGGYEKSDFAARRFSMNPYPGSGIATGDPEVVFGSEALGTDTLMNEITNANDSYAASNTLVGGYLQLETAMADWLKFLGLLRMEVFRQQVENRDPFDGDPGSPPIPPDYESPNTDRTDVDPMPSANLAFTINPEMFVKIGYGMTVIRPAIRELAPYAYTDFLRGWFITGNPDLERARVQNIEARYEYYFGKSNLFSVTGFYKYFKNPIEFVITSQVNGSATFANAEKAWLAGGEIELRLGFGSFTPKLERFHFIGNIALMKSETSLSAENAGSGRAQRPLYNQSPYVTNLSLRFDDPDAGVMVGLVYNAFGDRIVEVGGSGGDFIFPDVFEKAQHLLDLVATWKPTPHLKVGFKWKNIAFAKKRFQQGNELVLVENRGTSFSIGAEYIY